MKTKELRLMCVVLACAAAPAWVQAQQPSRNMPQQAQNDQRRIDLRSALMKAQGRNQADPSDGAPHQPGGMRQLSPEERATLRDQLRQQYR